MQGILLKNAGAPSICRRSASERSQKVNAVGKRFFGNVVRPERGLNLADVRFSQIIHTDTGLSDTASDGVGQFFVEQGFLERQFCALLASCGLQLASE